VHTDKKSVLVTPSGLTNSDFRQFKNSVSNPEIWALDWMKQSHLTGKPPLFVV
jgi:hypothetical protein